MDNHAGGNRRARNRRRRRCFKEENITPATYPRTCCIEEEKLNVKLSGYNDKAIGEINND